MLIFFSSHPGLQKFIASFVLVGFMILQASITLAPVASAEADPTAPPPALLMRAYEGTDPIPMIYVLNSDDAGGGSWVQLPFSTNTSAEISRPDADVTIQWQVEDPWRSGVELTSCTLYGGVAARNIPPQSGSLILHSPTPGLYIMNCEGGAAVSANVQLRVAGPHAPSGTFPPFSCESSIVPFAGTYSTRYFSTGYSPDALLAPAPPHENQASLKDISENCRVLGVPDNAAFSPWTSEQIPSRQDEKIGWPAVRANTERTTKVRYKNPQTATVCTEVRVVGTNYRVGFTRHVERVEDAFDYYVLDPFEISREAPITVIQEECIDRPLTDDIVGLTIPQCGTYTDEDLFTTTVTGRCDTNVIASTGHTATCRYEESETFFGGIFGTVLTALSVLMPGIGSFVSIMLTAITYERIDNYAHNVLDNVRGLVTNPSFGSVRAPHPDLGECPWSPGFTPQTVGEPLCTSGCAFDPKTVVEGQKTNYPWNFSPGVSRFDFSCTGDLGRWSGNIPADAPYSGTAEFYPRQTQSCALTLSNNAGVTKVYTDAVTVTPLAGAPTCSISFSPNRIRQGDTAIAGWKFSTDTARADYVCSGDIGSRTGVAVPKDFPYEGEAVVAPRQSQGCTATVYDISGQKSSCSASITVDLALPPATAAQFISQTVPSTITASQKYPVSVTMKNMGTKAWDSIGLEPNSYRLGSQNPQDNTTWGGRILLNNVVPAGGQTTFNFTVTAPATPGTYNFQWRMVEENVQWFGDFTPNVTVTVTAVPPAGKSSVDIIKTSFTALQQQHSGCTIQNVISGACNAAVKRFCNASGYGGGGFGPVEAAGDIAYVTCLGANAATIQRTTFTNLATQHPGCTAANPVSTDCNAAINRYCASQSYGGGFGPTEMGGNDAYVTCAAPSVSAPTKTSFTALAAQHPDCTAANPLSGACNAAVNRFCVSSGYRSGFGPVEMSGANADVVCLRSGDSANADAAGLFASIISTLKVFLLHILE